MLRHQTERSRHQMLERFLFDGAMQWSKIEKLSGRKEKTVPDACFDECTECTDPG